MNFCRRDRSASTALREAISLSFVKRDLDVRYVPGGMTPCSMGGNGKDERGAGARMERQIWMRGSWMRIVECCLRTNQWAGRCWSEWCFLPSMRYYAALRDATQRCTAIRYAARCNTHASIRSFHWCQGATRVKELQRSRQWRGLGRADIDMGKLIS